MNDSVSRPSLMRTMVVGRDDVGTLRLVGASTIWDVGLLSELILVVIDQDDDVPLWHVMEVVETADSYSAWVGRLRHGTTDQWFT